MCPNLAHCRIIFRGSYYVNIRNPSTSHMLYHSRPKHPHISSQIYSSFEELRWVDLGLPSGTLWAETDIGMMNYIAALNRYGENLPSKENIQELENFCVAKWDQEKQCMVFTGRNGNQISFYCKDKCNSWWGKNIVGSYYDKTFAERLHIDPPFGLYFNDLEVEKASKVRLIKPNLDRISKKIIV